jgi:hypothetical protein
LGRRSTRNVRGCRDTLADAFTGLERRLVKVGKSFADAFTRSEGWLLEPTDCRVVNTAGEACKAATRPPNGLFGREDALADTFTGLERRLVKVGKSFADAFTRSEGWLLEPTDCRVVNTAGEACKAATRPPNGLFGREDALADALASLECCSVHAPQRGVLDITSPPTEPAAELESLLVEAAECHPSSLAGLKRRLVEAAELLPAAGDRRAECGPNVVAGRPKSRPNGQSGPGAD